MREQNTGVLRCAQNDEREEGGGDHSWTRSGAQREAGEGADGEGGPGPDEDVPGEGDVGDGDGTEVHGKTSLPQPEIEGEAADHAKDSAALVCKAGEGAEQKDPEQATIGYGGDGKTDLDDVALAAGADGVDRDGEEDEGPENG